jgi:hypothetical protein
LRCYSTARISPEALLIFDKFVGGRTGDAGEMHDENRTMIL